MWEVAAQPYQTFIHLNAPQLKPDLWSWTGHAVVHEGCVKKKGIHSRTAVGRKLITWSGLRVRVRLTFTDDHDSCLTPGVFGLLTTGTSFTPLLCFIRIDCINDFYLAGVLLAVAAMVTWSTRPSWKQINGRCSYGRLTTAYVRVIVERLPAFDVNRLPCAYEYCWVEGSTLLSGWKQMKVVGLHGRDCTLRSRT